jgi:hypothetical protein
MEVSNWVQHNLPLDQIASLLFVDPLAVLMPDKSWSSEGSSSVETAA